MDHMFRGKIPKDTMTATVEAIIGAIYFCGGFAEAKKAVHHMGLVRFSNISMTTSKRKVANKATGSVIYKTVDRVIEKVVPKKVIKFIEKKVFEDRPPASLLKSISVKELSINANNFKTTNFGVTISPVPDSLPNEALEVQNEGKVTPDIQANEKQNMDEKEQVSKVWDMKITRKIEKEQKHCLWVSFFSAYDPQLALGILR